VSRNNPINTRVFPERQSDKLKPTAIHGTIEQLVRAAPHEAGVLDITARKLTFGFTGIPF